MHRLVVRPTRRACSAHRPPVRVLVACALTIGAVLLPSGGVQAQSPDVPVIAAAADLNAALPEIVKRFTSTTGKMVKLSFGSSGAFTQQIANGAPFEVLLSADESYVQRLVALGLTDGGGALYAIGRIGLFLPNGSRMVADSLLRGVGSALSNGSLQKFAIANPVHAPYGRAAQQALQRLGLWRAVQPHLVFGENAAQATQFATSGSAQGGIIPLSLAYTAQVKAAGSFTLLDDTLHDPLRQRAVLLKRARATARAFYAFLQSPDARAIFQRYGFLLPP